MLKPTSLSVEVKATINLRRITGVKNIASIVPAFVDRRRIKLLGHLALHGSGANAASAGRLRKYGTKYNDSA
jgi:hypothetical protein